MQQTANTIASVSAAILAAASLVLSVYQLGDSDRKTAAVRNAVRSAIGEEVLLTDESGNLMTKALADRQEMRRRWNHVQSQLLSLRSVISSAIPQDDMLIAGVDDAIDVANLLNRPDYLGQALDSNSTLTVIGRYQYFLGVEQTVKDARALILRAAGEVR